MKPMSKTAALKLASTRVSIHGRGTDWLIVGPYRYDHPYGPYTQRTATSYRGAIRLAARWKANIALTLMDRYSDRAYYTIHSAMRDDGIGDTRELVNIGLRA